jgi:carbamoyl-phosphate synthase large subunit
VKNYYVSSVGGDISQSIINIIKSAFPQAVLFGTDLDNQNSGCQEVENFEVSPKASSADYLNWLQDFLIRNNIDIFIPVNENELETLAMLSDSELNNLLGRTSIIWAGSEAVKLFGSKRNTSNYLMTLGIKVPRVFRDPVDILKSDYPVVVKPERGAGSRNVFVCRSIEEVKAAIVLSPNCIIQQHIGDADSEYTAGVFRSLSGEVRVIVFQRKLSGGATGWAKVVVNIDFEALCRRIAESINLNGAINIQFRLDKGEPSVFEVNGRFSSTVMIRHILGFTDFIWSCGELSGFYEFSPDKIEGQIGYKVNRFAVRKM